jgi:hypothetical protein
MSRVKLPLQRLIRQESEVMASVVEACDNAYVLLNMPGCVFAYIDPAVNKVVSYWDIPWHEGMVTFRGQNIVFTHTCRSPEMGDDEIELDLEDPVTEAEEEDVTDDETPEAVIERESNAFIQHLVDKRAEILTLPILPNTPTDVLIEQRVDLAFKAVLDTLDGKSDGHPACMVVPYEAGANEVIQDMLITHPMAGDCDVKPIDIAGSLCEGFFENVNT